MNSDCMGRKRKHNEMATYNQKENMKNIVIQTKRDIDYEKKELKKLEREKKKLMRQGIVQPEQAVEESETSIKHVDELKIDISTQKDDGDTSQNGNDTVKHKEHQDASKCDGDNFNTDLCTPKRKITKVCSSNVLTTNMLEPSANKVADNFESSGVNVYEYAESRAFEIRNLQIAIKAAKYCKNKMVFQTLPRHMRRRAASHDVKRIPRRLQERAKDANLVPKKPPTRKYKRRPKNLMEEYNRRSKLHSWLETHMWHAKRFKMMDKWGYRVPAKPCDKAFRAIYRASAKSCLLQDKSYMEFIEVIGSENVIINGFQRITSANCLGGIPVNDEKCLSGQNYGEGVIYSHDSYPCHVIGCVRFIWASVSGTTERKLIVLCHPSNSTDIMNELEIIFDVVKVDSTIDDLEKNVDQEVQKSVIHEKKSEDLSQNKHDNSVTVNTIKVIHHKLDFVMFSLTGPLSLQILQNIFKFPKCTKSADPHEDGYVTNVNNVQTWNVLDDSICQHKCALYNLSVEDPRFHIPYKKQNPFSTQTSESTRCISSNTPVSMIWDEVERNKAKDGKLSDEQINNIRHKQLIPSSTLPLTSVQIPVAVMQRYPRYKGEQEYGCGFDLVLPFGWAMPFWISLVYQGACVGGVEADENVSLEALSTHFPTLYPDSKVYQEHVNLQLKERMQKYKSYPPDKRLNYNKLGIKNPFAIPWLHLVAEWKHIIKILMNGCSIISDIQFSKCEQDFYVLREKSLLCELKELMTGQIQLKNKEQLIVEMLRYPDSLIPVNITPLQVGIPKENATLCIPTLEEIALLNVKENSKNNECHRYSEPHHKGCMKDFPFVCKKSNILLPNAATIGGNTRWIIGYVQNGAYSFTSGKGNGVGFISTIGLVYLLHENNDTRLLFRNTNTFEYLFCSLDILLL